MAGEMKMKKIIIQTICILILVNSNMNSDGKKYSICREKGIGGIEFKFCVEKDKLKKGEELNLLFYVKIPKEKEIYVTHEEINYRFYEGRNEIEFYLGASDILGDWLPIFFDLKKYSKVKNNIYKDELSFEIEEIGKKINIKEKIKLKFDVSFSKKLIEPMKSKLLKEGWYYSADHKKDWYPECLGSFYDNFINNEEIGSIIIEIIDKS